MKDKINNIISSFKNFYNNTYGMPITLSWVLLVICLIIKLFGGNWFELGSENSKFIEFCLYVDNHIWLKMTLACLICLGSTYFIMCLLLNKKKLNKKDMLIYLPLIVAGSLTSWHLSIISLICQLIYLIILPIIQTRAWKRIILTILITFIFQFISILFRNFGTFDFNNNSFIYQVLIQIDYYLMLILYYLYTFKRKESK